MYNDDNDNDNTEKLEKIAQCLLAQSSSVTLVQKV